MLAKAALAALLAVTSPQPPSEPTTPKLWRAIAQCETGYHLDHITKSYVTALGFSKRSYLRWGGRMSQRTDWRQTMLTAERLAYFGYTNSAGEYVYPVGVWGWGCLREGSTAHALLCASKKPHVQRWKRHCS